MLSRTALFVSIVAAAANAQVPEPKFTPITIDNRIQIGYGLAIADVDGDGWKDVLLADKKQFVWYRNPGPEKVRDTGGWQKHVLAENLTAKDNVCITAEDIDGDGKCEVAVGAEWNPADTENSGAVFYLIPPQDRTQRWEAVKLHAEPTTHRMRWVKVAGENHSGAQGEVTRSWALLVAPLHGRGNKNGEGAAVKIFLYHPPATLNDPEGKWRTELVNESMHMTHNFDVQRINGAPDSVLLGGREGLVTLKFRHGKVAGQASHNPVGFAGAGEVRVGKLTDNNEYFATIEPMHGTRLKVYTGKDGDISTAKSVQLTDKLADGHALACGDLIKAGSDQIVVGWRGNPQQLHPVGIKVFTAMDPDGSQWRESIVDENGIACEDLQLADLDKDGSLDIIGAGRATKNVKIYWNEVRN